MLTISNLSVHFGGRYLFDGVTFTLKQNDRVGLIGRNGTGKSTLLKIIAEMEQPEEGIIIQPNDYTIGYLPQEAEIFSERELFEEAASALEEIKFIDEKIEHLTHALNTRTDYESKEYLDIAVRLAELNERFTIIGGTSVDSEIENILIGLGFSRSDFYKKISEFSGGWQMRLELAKILLRKPDCILLDEPTNHLDIDSIRWLENFLRNYKGSVVIVSHDRNFLDTVTNRTIEISLGKIYDLALSYSKFVEYREEQKKQNLAAYQNQQKQIADTEKFIERFRYKATLASRVQSRVKQLEKINLIELEDEDYSSIKFQFPQAQRSGRVVAEVNNLYKSYGTNQVLDNVNFAIERGDKIAFIGRNGEGKSTFSKILAGSESFEGNLKIGHNVGIAYFDQHQARLLESDSSVFDIIDSAAIGEMRTKVRSLLGAFLFRGEDIYKKVKVLSGGEKSRLAIAKMLLNPANFMILDEPTNHLDMVSKDVLKNALLQYDGALILVSHDREFLHGLTNKTVYFKDMKIREYTGDIYDFLEKQKIENLSELESLLSKNNLNFKEEKIISKSQIDRLQQKQFQKEERRIKKLIEITEKNIESIENNIRDIENDFGNPEISSDTKLLLEKKFDYDRLRKDLNDKTEEWMLLQEELEKLNENKFEN